MNIVCLLNGFTGVRERRGSEGVTVLECGCAHTDIKWVQMCRACGGADEALHVRAAEDHARDAAIKELIS